MAEFDQYRDDYVKRIDDALSCAGAKQEFFTQLKADLLNPIIRDAAVDHRPVDVLDVGCGHGLIHPMLTAPAVGMNLVGVDMAGDVIDWAKKTHSENTYYAYDGQRLPFEEGRFALAFTICVLHHVPPSQWPKFLAEMSRVVRPGGRVVVIEHNPFNPLTQYIVRTCPIDENAVLVRQSRLEELMRGAELTKISTRYFTFTPFTATPFRALENMIGWIPLGAQYMTTAEHPSVRSDQ